MAEADASYVQVANDGSGKKIRNLVTAKAVLDGVPDANLDQQRYIQVVALADADGRLIPAFDMGVLYEILAAQQQTNELLEVILEKF
jgi:hypothetical protein